MKQKSEKYGIVQKNLPWFTDDVIICLDHPTNQLKKVLELTMEILFDKRDIF